ncbi:MAG: hypothetical protein AAGA64_11005 [Bacteroidota bacterium]
MSKSRKSPIFNSFLVVNIIIICINLGKIIKEQSYGISLRAINFLKVHLGRYVLGPFVEHRYYEHQSNLVVADLAHLLM